jgi:hypothetical protein
MKTFEAGRRSLGAGMGALGSDPFLVGPGLEQAALYQDCAIPQGLHWISRATVPLDPSTAGPLLRWGILRPVRAV